MNSPKKNPYERVVKQFLILLSLLFLAPFLFNIALKAQRIYITAPKIYIAYLLLFSTGFLLIFTVWYGFKTVRTFLSVLFEDEK